MVYPDQTGWSLGKHSNRVCEKQGQQISRLPSTALWAIIAAHVDEIWKLTALNTESYSVYGTSRRFASLRKSVAIGAYPTLYAHQMTRREHFPRSQSASMPGVVNDHDLAGFENRFARRAK